MKTIKNIQIAWAFILVSSFLIISCESKLDIAPPNSLVDEQIMELLLSDNPDDVNFVLSSLAGNLDENFRLNQDFTGFSGHLMNPLQSQNMILNLRANDIVIGEKVLGTSGDILSLYSLDNAAIKPWTANNRWYNYTWWKCAATPHTNANKVLAYLSEETVEKGLPVLKDYRARALSVRAFGYMLLMERYSKSYLHGGKDVQGMPIYTEYKANEPAPIASGEETYNFIKGDLQEAIRLLKQLNLPNDGYSTGPEATNDIDMGVIQFLLARVSLWTGDYATCIQACQDILSHYPDFIKEEAYGVKNKSLKALVSGTEEAYAENNGFTNIEKNPECILGWVDGNGAYTYHYSYFNVFSEGTGGVGRNYMRIDDRLYDQIAEDDFRKELFTTEAMDYTYPTDKIPYTIPVYANLKWGATICLGQTARNKELNNDNVFFRKSEVLLMLAESQALSGEEGNAKTTLNILLAARTKAGAPTLSCDNYPSMQSKSIMEMVKIQWKIEMWGEDGLDYFNSKRWNEGVNRSGSKSHWSIGKELPVEYMTYQIPELETNFNGHWNK